MRGEVTLYQDTKKLRRKVSTSRVAIVKYFCCKLLNFARNSLQIDNFLQHTQAGDALRGALARGPHARPGPRGAPAPGAGAGRGVRDRDDGAGEHAAGCASGLQEQAIVTKTLIGN